MIHRTLLESLARSGRPAAISHPLPRLRRPATTAGRTGAMARPGRSGDAGARGGARRRASSLRPGVGRAVAPLSTSTSISSSSAPSACASAWKRPRDPAKFFIRPAADAPARTSSSGVHDRVPRRLTLTALRRPGHLHGDGTRHLGADGDGDRPGRLLRRQARVSRPIGRPAGRAALLATTVVHIAESHSFRVDLTMLFFVTLAWLFALRIAEQRALARLSLGGRARGRRDRDPSSRPRSSSASSLVAHLVNAAPSAGRRPTWRGWLDVDGARAEPARAERRSCSPSSTRWRSSTSHKFRRDIIDQILSPLYRARRSRSGWRSSPTSSRSRTGSRPTCGGAWPRPGGVGPSGHRVAGRGGRTRLAMLAAAFP